MFLGVGFDEAFSVVVSSIGNVGPGLGDYGPAFSWNALPDAAKWILSFLMLIGRLEMFCVLLLFYPSFWKTDSIKTSIHSVDFSLFQLIRTVQFSRYK